MKKINSKLFKQALSKYATGITIVTINNNKFLGKTVNSFASLSLKPPLVLFSLDNKSTQINKYKNSKFIGINILSKKQKNLSNYFASKNPKWDDIDYYLSSNNTPMIKNSVINLDCENKKTIKEGDHLIFICKIINIFIIDDKKSLIYVNSNYY
jgi:flavin reductase (DIM6/NTAB) family NADH-FMN oxidoreductase RutF